MQEPGGISLTLPHQIHEDIVILQGQEIIRIRNELETSEAQLKALQDENEALRAGRGDDTKEVDGVADELADDSGHPEEPPSPPPAEEPEPAVRLIDPQTAFINSRRLPAYGNQHIPAFYIGRSPRRCIKVLKQAMGYIRVAVLRSGESEWRDRYNTCLVARPDKRRKRDGTWVDSKISKLQRSIHVVASVFGRWYYLGQYQCQQVDTLDPRAYDMLEPMTKRAFLRFMAHGEDREEAKSMISRGEIHLLRLRFHRITWDEDVQKVLLGAAAKDLPDDADSDASED